MRILKKNSKSHKIPNGASTVVKIVTIKDVRTFTSFLLDFVGALIVYRTKYAEFIAIFAFSLRKLFS